MDVKHDGLSHVVLAHLSQQNNTPRHALREVGQALYQSRTKLVLADQTHGSDMFDLK
jgi:phosphoribosyl 1,2-cyclic phosphodiesterase